MRSNYLSAVLFSLVALPLVACGGDDDGMVVVPDAKVFMDAPADSAVAACLFPASIPAFTLPASGPPASNDWIRKGTSGALNGVTFFGITIVLDEEMKTDITLIVPRPTNGFETNVPYAFDTDPNTSSLPIALAFAGDNVDAQGNALRTLWASSGALTFTAVGQAAGNAISATVSMTNLREIDENGADVAGGCTTSFAGMTLNLSQKTTVAGPPVPSTPSQAIRWTATNFDRVTINQ